MRRLERRRSSKALQATQSPTIYAEATWLTKQSLFDTLKAAVDSVTKHFGTIPIDKVPEGDGAVSVDWRSPLETALNCGSPTRTQELLQWLKRLSLGIQIVQGKSVVGLTETERSAYETLLAQIAAGHATPFFVGGVLYDFSDALNEWLARYPKEICRYAFVAGAAWPELVATLAALIGSSADEVVGLFSAERVTALEVAQYNHFTRPLIVKLPNDLTEKVVVPGLGTMRVQAFNFDYELVAHDNGLISTLQYGTFGEEFIKAVLRIKKVKVNFSWSTFPVLTPGTTAAGFLTGGASLLLMTNTGVGSADIHDAELGFNLEEALPEQITEVSPPRGLKLRLRKGDSTFDSSVLLIELHLDKTVLAALAQAIASIFVDFDLKALNAIGDVVKEVPPTWVTLSGFGLPIAKFSYL